MTAQLTSALGVPPGIMGDVAAAGTRQTLVGRDAELAELSSLLGVRPPELDPSPTPRAVLLAGDAGVGKTRLLTELRDLAVADGWQVVAGHCLDFGDSALPYLPFSEVMGRLATDLPDVVETVSGVHPALGRLQPGRRMLSGAARTPAPSTAATCSRRCTHCSRRRGQGPAAAGDRGRPLGRPVHPRHDQLPVLPAVRRPGRRSWSATAPRTSTAATRCAARSPSGRGSAASTGSSSTRSPTPRSAPWSVSCIPTRSPRPTSPTSSTAPRATRSSSRSSSAPPGAAGSPRTSPRCCWSASTGSTTPPARWSGRCRSPAARSPTACSPRPAECPPTRSTRRCGRPSSRTSWSPPRPLLLPPRAARRGDLRRPAAG